MNNPRRTQRLSRREFLMAIGATTALAGLSGCGPSGAPTANTGGAAPTNSNAGQTGAGTAPTSGGTGAAAASGPVNLTIIDVAGNLQLTKAIIEEYAQKNSDKVSNIAYTNATAPELTSKIKAQQGANQVDIALVLTGTDGLSAGIEQGLWVKLLPDYDAKFPNLMQNYIAPEAQNLAQGYGINIVFGNYGPTFTYNPQKLQTTPKSPQELLDFARANPNQFMYARPANSGPGRSFLMGLPYVLGDADPKDPEKGWDKTWTFLEDLGQYVEYYPSGTTATMKELADGSRAAVASTMGWDMNPRALGTVPKDFGVFAFDNKNLVADAQFAAIPNGLDEQRLQVVLDLIATMLTPQQQAKTYDQGYFYPGPAVKNVTLDMAPQASQEAIKAVARPQFDEMIKNATIQMPLDAKSLVTAFSVWDERIGGNKVKKS